MVASLRVRVGPGCGRWDMALSSTSQQHQPTTVNVMLSRELFAGPGGAAGGEADVRDHCESHVLAVGAELQGPAAAGEPVGQRVSLGDAHAPLCAHPGVPLAGGAHGERPSHRAPPLSALAWCYVVASALLLTLDKNQPLVFCESRGPIQQSTRNLPYVLRGPNCHWTRNLPLMTRGSNCNQTRGG